MPADSALELVKQMDPQLRIALRSDAANGIPTDDVLAQHIAKTVKGRIALQGGALVHRGPGNRWQRDREGVSLHGATDAALAANGGSNAKRRKAVAEKARAMLTAINGRDFEQDGAALLHSVAPKPQGRKEKK